MINTSATLFAACSRRGISSLVAACALLAPAGMPAAFAGEQAAIPAGVDCVTVRYYVHEHGRAKSIAWALKNGFSWAQISEAKRCLRS